MAAFWLEACIFFSASPDEFNLLLQPGGQSEADEEIPSFSSVLALPLSKCRPISSIFYFPNIFEGSNEELNRLNWQNGTSDKLREFPQSVVRQEAGKMENSRCDKIAKKNGEQYK